ncbi:PREDICTED: dof zinc finger protein DOF2.1-like isoform X3 [Lupinus angustifolius]|uniref:dof zinc finger protein DOF2.1-like isoform X3 n=1 Tax=Lupinus angustifolius TaxID=3871 RepID=UPI00092E2896|nr:PREDICTED: dof zinc finger protein DOF2.1-like isoform X3 [Lupinus angustifolius]
MNIQTLEKMLTSSNSQQERKPRSEPEHALKCPRCDSTNTKFCYYNNYSLSQPRYFCKSCKRYWTKGGTLRNVPVGGGCRKAKRSSSKKPQDQTFPHLTYEYSSDTLTLGFQKQSLEHLGFNPTSTKNNGLLESHRSGFLGTQKINDQNMYYVYGNGDMVEVDNGKSGMMMLPYDEAMRVSGNRVLGGFPWELSGDTNMGEVDSGITSWNGLTSSWHGILHSPLI